MSTITPSAASQMAKNIYSIQAGQRILIQAFLKRSEFSGQGLHLNAEVGSRLLNTRDGFGMCARGGGNYDKDIFLIFRGTTTANMLADWVNNARIGATRASTGHTVHIGFNSIFESMKGEIQRFLDSQKDATGTVHCIGHSLGGAIATLAADWVSSKGKSTKLYSFAAPKVGMEDFAGRLGSRMKKANIYRVYHSTDLVPMVPVYPFVHAPIWDKSYQLPSGGLVSLASHKMQSYINSLNEISDDWLSVKKVSIETIDEHSVKRWIKSGKPFNPANPKTWEWINAALVFVIRKVVGNSAIFIQSPFISGLTLADRIAWMLSKGITATLEAGEWILHLMRKIMRALAMKVVKTAQELTHLFMRKILQILLDRMCNEAARVVRNLINDL